MDRSSCSQRDNPVCMRHIQTYSIRSQRYHGATASAPPRKAGNAEAPPQNEGQVFPKVKTLISWCNCYIMATLLLSERIIALLHTCQGLISEPSERCGSGSLACFTGKKPPINLLISYSCGRPWLQGQFGSTCFTNAMGPACPHSFWRYFGGTPF